MFFSDWGKGSQKTGAFAVAARCFTEDIDEAGSLQPASSRTTPPGTLSPRRTVPHPLKIALIPAGNEPLSTALKACRSIPDKFPKYTYSERVADGVLHVIGVMASLAAATILIVFAFQHLPSLSLVSLAIYGVGIVAVFGCSAAYHLINRPSLKAILRRCDHAAIYFKIAGTYTPFAMLKIGGTMGFGLLGIVWVISVFGATAKLLWPKHFVRTSYVLYIALGSSVILTLAPLAPAISPQVLLLLAAGGCLYTIGIVFHLWEQLRYHNAIWHAFVLAASACHFAAVAEAVMVL